MPVFKLGFGIPLGSGGQYMSWISLADEVAAVRFLLDRPDVAGPLNLTAPHPVTNSEFTEALNAALGRPAVLRLPVPGLRLPGSVLHVPTRRSGWPSARCRVSCWPAPGWSPAACSRPGTPSSTPTFPPRWPTP